MATTPDLLPTLLRRDGVSQLQRHLPALDPLYAQLDERSETDLVAFAAAYAKKIQFYPANELTPDSTAWQELFPALDAPTLATTQARSDTPPHYALFLAFLKLFGLAQNQLNAFTQRHLDFYYREVLRLVPRPAVPDQVHLTFELARGLSELKVPAGTLADAGTDALEQPVLYQTVAERLLNRASLAHVQGIYTKMYNTTSDYSHPNDTGAIYFAPNVATADGVAADLPADDPTWDAFAPPRQADNLAWPKATVGFAVAAPILRLAEGKRIINLRIRTRNNCLNSVSQYYEAQLSGPDGWITASVDADSDDPYMWFTVTLDATQPAVVDYNPKVLDGGYATEAPVLRLLLKDGAYEWVKDIKWDICSIDVEVSGIQRGIVLSNDQGRLSADKPFMPFGPTPEPGAGLYIDYPEASAKYLTTVTAGISKWNNLPNEGLSGYYAEWNDDHYNINPHYYESLTNYAGEDYDEKVPLEVILRTSNWPQETLVAGMFDSFPGHSLVFEGDAAITFSRYSSSDQAPALAPASVTDGWYRNYRQQGNQVEPVRTQSLPNRPAQPLPGSPLLSIYLGRDFGHSQYATLLYRISQREFTNPPPPPHQPYTPVASSLTMSYTATTDDVKMLADADKDGLPLYSQRSIQLLHITPFGWAEEHPHLKHEQLFLDSYPDAPRTQAYMVPQLHFGGTFLLGLRDAAPRTSVPVLFQLAEGSANTERPPYEVRWSALSNNQWYPLKSGYAPLDHTNNLLTSGIIEFSLPAEITTTNTLLPAGITWLKAELFTLAGQPAAPDSVARVVGVHPQVIRATFTDQRNDPAHYDQALPAGTATRLWQAPPGLKAVQQPYPSFGGRAAESEAAFYTRVSERLRHKQRAVTVWDYERLVLEQFPQLHRVRCLIHTRLNPRSRTVAQPNPPGLLEMVPGWVSLVVIPGKFSALGAKALRPTVDANTLAAITSFLQERVGPQVRVEAINPVYEAVRVSGSIAFQSGQPFAQDAARLSQDLRDFLSPHAPAPADEPDRSRVLRIGAVLAFIESLPYVDVVTGLALSQQNSSGIYTSAGVPLRVSTARSILTSAPTHLFTPLA